MGVMEANHKFEAQNPNFETISNDQIPNVRNKLKFKTFEF